MNTQISNQFNDENRKSDQISSRYMSQNHKKYLLAGVNQSIDQLNREQVDILTKLLITLKSEYDTLTREVTNKKTEMEKISKQTSMLERMDNKQKKKIAELEDKGQEYEINLLLHKKKLNEEEYAKESYLHIIEKIKNDLSVISIQINEKEKEVEVLNKQLEKERHREASIKIEFNKIFSNIEEVKKKNSQNKNENDLIIKYYNTIIQQKRSFIEGADERKINQERIAQQAKNDTQDKQEVEKRKLLHLNKLYNNYLRKKVEMSLKDNEELEKTFQKIKSITGITSMKVIVDKILNKDKDYNSSVLKITEKEDVIDRLKEEIKGLEEKYKELKNNCKLIIYDLYMILYRY